MQRVVRSTLLGLLTLAGVTACGDKVTGPSNATQGVVHGVTVTPATAQMNVGDSLTFVASVNADASVTNRGVTWTSSNPGVASVSSTGSVHALTTGTTSIIATSAADPTQSGAAVVTVGGGNSAPPTITVSTINQTVCGAGGCNSVPANLANVAGQIDVTFNVDAMGQKLQSVSLVLNCTGNGNSGKDTVVATQTVSSSQIAAEAQSSPITLSFNTASFNSTTGAVAFKNGQCTVKGQAVTLSGTTPTTTTSASQAITLNNVDVVVVSPAISTTPTAPQLASATDATGRLWNAGAVNVSAIPVIYSGNSVVSGSITLLSGGPNTIVTGVDKNGANIVGGQVIASTTGITPTNGALTVTFPNSTTASNGVGGMSDSLLIVSISTVNSAGNAGPSFITTFTNGVAPTGTFLRLDNKAPDPTGVTVNFNYNNNSGNWVGSSFNFSGQGATSFITSTGNALPDWGAGVDKVVFNAQYSTTAAPTTWIAASSPSGIPESSSATSYNFRFQICDALMNCVNSVPTSANGITTFGVDVTPPKIVSYNGPKNLEIDGIGQTVTNGGNITTTLSDSSGSGSSVTGSGFGASPLLATVVQLAPKTLANADQVSRCTTGTASTADANGNTTCKAAALEANGFQTLANNLTGTTEGQYMVSVEAIDQAGNTSPAMAVSYYTDQTAPVVSPNNISVPGTVTTGTAFTANATDNMDVAAGNGRLNYTTAALNFLEGGSANPAGVAFDNTLTRAAAINVTLGTFYQSLATINGATLSAGEKPENLFLRAIDAANNLSAAQVLALPPGNIAGTGATPYTVGNTNTNSLQGFVVTASTSPASGPPPVVSVNGTTANTARSASLQAQVTAATLQSNTPFTSVCFYYQNLTGAEGGLANLQNGGAAGDLALIGCTTTPPADVTGPTGRTFTYTMSWTPGSKMTAGVHNVFAVGVDANTNGMVTVPTTVSLVP